LAGRLGRQTNALVGAELRIDSMSRPKNAQNSTKKAKINFCRKNSLTSPWTNFSDFIGKIFLLCPHLYCNFTLHFFVF
jgi:hypothetical protein